MKINIVDLNKKVVEKYELPKVFEEEYRPDLIWRAFLVIRANKRQRYGAKPDAGKNYSAKLSRRRRAYRGAYGYGISRVPRKILIRRGMRFYWIGAVAPNTVGGRRAHPPKSEKEWKLKINKKERRKAIRSALRAVLIKEIVKSRGHKIPDDYPFAIIDEFQNIKKTKEVYNILVKLGFKDELERSKKKKVRAGKGKMRGRRYVKKKGLLIVVSKNCDLMKSARNIPGIDVIHVKDLNVELLAPGAQPGRATLFTKGALEYLKHNNLFMG